MLDFKSFLLSDSKTSLDEGLADSVTKENIIEIIELLEDGDCEAVLEAIMDVLDSIDPLEDCDGDIEDCLDDPIEFEDEFGLEIYESFVEFLENEDISGLTEEELNEIKNRFTNKKKGTRKFKKRKVQLKRDKISRKAELRKKRLEYRVKKRKNLAKKKMYRKTYNRAVSQGKHKPKKHR